jgi:aconitate hydratase 2/2-methylisocitrate dehydratase
VAKAGKKNEFSGRILEIEGLPDLKVEQAFELSDASAERSAAGCTIKLNPEPIKEYLTSNVVLMKNMIADGYQDAHAGAPHRQGRRAWLANPTLLEADKDAEYAPSSRSTWPRSRSPSSAARTTRTTPSSCPRWPAPRSTRPSSAAA